MKKSKTSALKIFSYLILSLVVLVFLVTFAFFKSNTASESLSRTWNIKNDARKLLSNVINAETGQRGFLITLDSAYLNPYNVATGRYRSVFNELKYLVVDDKSQTLRLAKIDSLVTLKFNEMKQTIDYVNIGDSQKALELVDRNAGYTYMNQIRLIILEFVVEENEFLAERNKNYENWKLFILSLIVLSILLILYSAFTLFRKVNPLFIDLIATQDKLKRSNLHLSETLDESKTLNKQKELTLFENTNLIQSLKTKNEQLDHFAYVASHDLQEPLRTVSNYLEVFQEDYEEKLDEDASKYFGFINDAVDRMRNLIAGLLTFSRLGTSGKVTKVDLDEALRDVKDGYKVRIDEINATIDAEILPVVYGYKLELTQLLQNLVSNAMKFRRKDITPVIKIDGEEKDGFYLIRVADNGIGMKHKDLEKIFDMFSRLHSTRSYEGQGIGLAFCKKIVELHHGKIWVTSELGLGTTFHFTLKKNL